MGGSSTSLSGPGDQVCVAVLVAVAGLHSVHNLLALSSPPRRVSLSSGGLVPPLAHVAHPRSNHPLVDIALLTRLEATFGRLAPWTDGVSVTLRLATTTTVGMVV